MVSLAPWPYRHLVTAEVVLAVAGFAAAAVVSQAHFLSALPQVATVAPVVHLAVAPEPAADVPQGPSVADAQAA